MSSFDEKFNDDFDNYFDDDYREYLIIKEQRKKMSVPETIFEECLNNLHNKWNRLSNEDEEIIMRISKKY